MHKSRTQHLMSQSRYDSAIAELQMHVSEEPDDPLRACHDFGMPHAPGKC